MSQRRFFLLPSALLFLAAPVLADDPPSAEGASPVVAPAAGTKTDGTTTGPVDLSTTKNNGDDLARQLADTQDKLTTALHSYSLLQDENTQLKADAEKSAADKSALDAQFAEANTSIAALKSQAAAATQVDGLREQLRQSQNQIAALATENAELRTHLAFMNSAPGGPSAPMRPSAAGARAAEAPLSGAKAGSPANLATATPPSAEGAGRGPAPSTIAKADLTKTEIGNTGKVDDTKTDLSNPAKAGPRIYTVVAGDSLSKISKKCYGTANRWDKILAANRDVIKNENTIVVGAKLKIP